MGETRCADPGRSVYRWISFWKDMGVVGMNTVKVYKAGSLRYSEVPSLHLEAVEPTTDDMFNTKTWPQIQEFFDGEAKLIVDAMVTSLPGGTIDAVLRELLTRKACLLRVTL